MECPHCGKDGPYTDDNGYDVLGYSMLDGGGEFRCRDCKTRFWWR